MDRILGHFDPSMFFTQPLCTLYSISQMYLYFFFLNFSSGTHHVETLKEMLLRAHQQLTAESIPSVPAVVSSPFGSPHSMKHLAALSASSSARAPPISSSAKVSSSASLLRSVTEAAATATSSESGAINTTSGAAGSAPGRKAGTAVARATLLTAKLSLNSNKTTDGPKPSHFKQSYLLNKLLYPEETGVTHPLRLSSHDGGGGSGAADEEFLLQDMVSLESLLGEEVVASTARGSATDASSDDLSAVPVRIHDFIQKILLHAKLSYDGNISGVMAPSIAQVALTTWTLQVRKCYCFFLERFPYLSQKLPFFSLVQFYLINFYFLFLSTIFFYIIAVCGGDVAATAR